MYEFSIALPYTQVEETAQRLYEVGIYNLYYEAPIEVTVTQNGYGFETNKERQVDLKVYADEDPEQYLSMLPALLSIRREEIVYRMVEINKWGQTFEDIELKNGWVIRYAGSDKEYKQETTLHLDPQGAFGTGIHGTTQDCLEVILERDFKEKKVLDLGTGSGILSIAALLRGAKDVMAVDLEPVEREILHHAHLNGVKPIQIVQADLIDGSYRIQDWFDWIFINIGGDEAKTIIDRHGLLEKSNHLLVSGLVEWHTEHVTSLFENAGFSLQKRLQSDEWVTMYFSK